MELTDDQRGALARAEAAERIMADPMVVEALAAIETSITEAWKDQELTAADREELHRIYKAQLRFVRIFETHLHTGQIVEQELGIRTPKKSFIERIKEHINGNPKA